jgi:hypothetical protein
MPCHDLILPELTPIVQEAAEKLQSERTLHAMVLIAFVFARRIAQVLLQSVLAERAHSRTMWPPCPECQTTLHSKGVCKRSIKTLIGTVEWSRRVGRCPNGCKVGVIAPFDVDLGLLPRQGTSSELKRVACALTIFVPFSTAALLIGQLCGVSVSVGAIWEWVQEAGSRAMKQLQQQLDRLATGEQPAEDITSGLTASPLLLGVDGVMAGFRPFKGSPRGRVVWREVKVGVVTRLVSEVKRGNKVVTKLANRRLVAVLGDTAALELRMRWMATAQGMLVSPRVVWISDGARGLWNIYERSFAAYAKGVLDFYHAAQHLCEGAQARFRGSARKAYVWFTGLRHKLRHGQSNAVIKDVEEALQIRSLPSSARETLTKLHAYLVKHQEHLDYKRVKQLGLPIGSGMVESACKWLIQQRFKGVGMRWSEEGFNHLLHLRLAWVNGTYDTLFASPNA